MIGTLSTIITLILHILNGYFIYNDSSKKLNNIKKNITWKWKSGHYIYITETLCFQIFLIFILINFYLENRKIKKNIEDGKLNENDKKLDNDNTYLKWKNKEELKYNKYTTDIQILNYYLNEKNELCIKNIYNEILNGSLKKFNYKFIYNTNKEDYFTEEYYLNIFNNNLFKYDLNTKLIRIRINLNNDNISSWLLNILNHLIILNKLNYHILSPIELCQKQTNNNYCLYDYLYNYNLLLQFPTISIYTITSLVIREDCFYLLNQLINKLSNIYSIREIIDLITLRTFTIWPPPLWFYSLLQLRILIRDGKKKIMKFNKLDQNLQQFILNPIENRLYRDILSFVHLPCQSIWLSDKKRFGLLEKIEYKL